jgi:hypothetical protein
MNEKHILTFTSWYTWDTIKLEFATDTLIEDWIEKIQLILLSASFTPEMVEDLNFKEEE